MSFTGAFVLNADRITARKSILICGMARGGTSFGGSVFFRLGVPFWRPDDPELRRTFEHKKLRAALLAEDFGAVGRLAADFGERFPVWGWKLPAIHRYFERTGECVPSPHFVIVFKEILSIAGRKNAQAAKDIVGRMVDVTSAYQGMVTLAGQTQHPCLLVSYDRAMANLAAFVGEAAAFAGVSQFDTAAVAAGIGEDQRLYLQGWERGQQERLARGGQKMRKRSRPRPSAFAPI